MTRPERSEGAGPRTGLATEGSEPVAEEEWPAKPEEAAERNSEGVAGKTTWCRGEDLNLHALWAPAPKAGVSAISPPRQLFS